MNTAARTSACPSALQYGGWRWSLLLEEDPHDVTGPIDRPEVQRFVCWDGERHPGWRIWRAA
jgi:hypothetical protein